MNKEVKNNIEFILLIIVIAISCFFIGKYFGNGCQEINAAPGETITGYIPGEKLTPVKEETPVNPDLPMKEVQVEIQYRDTGSVRTETKYITVTKKMVVDTAAIIADYIVKRSYSQTLFNNSNGKLEVFPAVYQNKLSSLGYEFTPKVKVWQPFVGTSYSTADYLGLGAGFFYHNLGVEYQYQIDLKGSNSIYQPRGNAHLIGVKYKFR